MSEYNKKKILLLICNGNRKNFYDFFSQKIIKKLE